MVHPRYLLSSPRSHFVTFLAVVVLEWDVSIVMRAMIKTKISNLGLREVYPANSHWGYVVFVNEVLIL